MMYQEFEATFPFEETPDQAKAIDEVLDDLKNGLSKSDVERLGVVTEVKGAKVSGQRVKEAWRWGMRGNLARIGTDIQCQWTFTYDARTFVMRVTARKDGWDKFKADAAEIFKSFRILEEPK
jgi:hypothetical protein